MKRALIPLTAIIALSIGSAAFTQSLSVSLGNRRGPQQPVNFSHQIHAGKLGMNCLYCHYGAEKSPVANVPPVGTCMGCHKIAATDRPEIQKLTGYWERGEQIPWVHVYRLPDYVKFNHKRHVLTGVACQTCHGQVQEMAVVYQYSSLKMGWCVTCHRQNQEKSQYQTTSTMDCIVCHH
jgi:cytochrome c7-like protein